MSSNTIVMSTGSIVTAPSSSPPPKVRRNSPRDTPYPRLFRSATSSRRATNRKPTSSVSIATRLATRENLKSKPRACESSQAGYPNTAMPSRPNAIRPRKIAKLRIAALFLERDGLVSGLGQHLEQAIVADKVQRANHHQDVLIAIEQRLDLGQPLAVAGA